MRRAVVNGREYPNTGQACMFASDDEIVEVYEDRVLLARCFVEGGEWVIRWVNYGAVPGGVVQLWRAQQAGLREVPPGVPVVA